MALFHLLSQANVDLRQPVSLEQQLMEDNDMDADVGLAMVQLLKVHFLLFPAFSCISFCIFLHFSCIFLHFFISLS